MADGRLHSCVEAIHSAIVTAHHRIKRAVELILRGCLIVRWVVGSIVVHGVSRSVGDRS